MPRIAVLVAIATRVVLVAETPTKSTLADALFTGSIWRFADGEHGSDQVGQRPRQVVLGDQDNLLIHAEMVDRIPRNRAVGRRGSQGARGQVLPPGGIAGRRRVNHPAPHGAVRADSGHYDPHQLSLSPSAALRQVDNDDGGLRAQRS